MMRHVTRKVLSVNGEASALCRLKPSAHARVYPSRTGVALASPSSRLQPSPARPFPVTLLEELCTVEDFSGLAGPTQDFFLAAAKRRSDWRTPPPPGGRAWIGQVREQGEGLISQKRRRRLRSWCEEAEWVAGPRRARRDGGDGVVGAYSERFHQQLSQHLSLPEAVQSQPHHS